MQVEDELGAIEARYQRRDAAGLDRVHDPLEPCNAFWRAEQQVAMTTLIRSWLGPSRQLCDCDIVEVGCGSGGNLVQLIGQGADPARIVANELRPASLDLARRRLPGSVRFIEGDARTAPIGPGTTDLALLFTVLSSIIDMDFRAELSRAVWSWLRPGGALLCYDMRYPNPANRDVRPIGIGELRRLFPQAELTALSVTLVPPLARRVAPLSGILFQVLGAVPPLRSHQLCLLAKRRG
jgi:SAM-dependent methyltransferase